MRFSFRAPFSHSERIDGKVLLLVRNMYIVVHISMREMCIFRGAIVDLPNTISPENHRLFRFLLYRVLGFCVGFSSSLDLYIHMGRNPEPRILRWRRIFGEGRLNGQFLNKWVFNVIYEYFYCIYPVIKMSRRCNMS